jgi:hypothetical protein
LLCDLIFVVVLFSLFEGVEGWIFPSVNNFLFAFDLKNNKNFEIFLSQKLINSEIMFLKFWIIFAKKFSFVNDVVMSHSRNFFAICVCVDKSFYFVEFKYFF